MLQEVSLSFVGLVKIVGIKTRHVRLCIIRNKLKNVNLVRDVNIKTPVCLCSIIMLSKNQLLKTKKSQRAFLNLAQKVINVRIKIAHIFTNSIMLKMPIKTKKSQGAFLNLAQKEINVNKKILLVGISIIMQRMLHKHLYQDPFSNFVQTEINVQTKEPLALLSSITQNQASLFKLILLRTNLSS